MFLIIWALFVFFAPNLLGDPNNFIPANPLQTPADIVPEWYFLPFYAILRSVPNKLLGVCMMFGSILVLFVLPWLDTSPVRSARFRPIYRQVIWLLVVVGDRPRRLSARTSRRASGCRSAGSARCITSCTSWCSCRCSASWSGRCRCRRASAGRCSAGRRPAALGRRRPSRWRRHDAAAAFVCWLARGRCRCLLRGAGPRAGDAATAARSTGASTASFGTFDLAAAQRGFQVYYRGLLGLPLDEDLHYRDLRASG